VTVTSAAAISGTASREVSLELIGLSRRFGSVVALDGLTFSVPPGQVFGFLGPNGAGKTTTIGAIFGVVALGSGADRGHDLRALHPAHGLSRPPASGAGAGARLLSCLPVRHRGE
jgi:ABC-type uncharacterized transport system ATPase subunit